MVRSTSWSDVLRRRPDFSTRSRIPVSTRRLPPSRYRVTSGSRYDVARTTRTFAGGVMPTRYGAGIVTRPSIIMPTRPTIRMPSRSIFSGGILPLTSAPLVPGGGVVPPSTSGLTGQLTGITGDVSAMGSDIVGKAREWAPIVVKIGIGLVVLKFAFWALRGRGR